MSFLIWLAAAAALLIAAAFLVARYNAAKAVAAVPPIGQITSVPGGAIHFVESGKPSAEAHSVVCIHGLSGNLHNLRYALTPLLETDFHVIALDRPGCGHSRRDDAGKAALREQGAMIMALLEKKGIERPILVGHSLGGALSLQMALDYPDKIGGLALLAPATRWMAQPPEVFKPLNIASSGLRNFLGHSFAGALAPLAAQKAADFVFAPEPAPADFAIRGGAALGLRPQGFISSSEDMLAAQAALEAIQTRYGALKTPGVVVYGAEDVVLDAALHGAGFTAEAPSLEYVELPGLGHMIPLTAPEACAAAVRRAAAMAAQPSAAPA